MNSRTQAPSSPVAGRRVHALGRLKALNARSPFPAAVTAECVDEAAVSAPRARGQQTSPRRPTRVLLVNANPESLRRMSARLLDDGYWVTAVSSFQLAKELLRAVRPDLLVADSRLAAYNGLHLAALSRFEHPSRPVVITHSTYDPVLEAEAERLNAKFIVNTDGSQEFLELVRGSLEEHRHALPPIRRWPRKRLPEAVEAQVLSTTARLFDVGYGGLRLELSEADGDLPAAFEISLPTDGLTVSACRVWTSRSGSAGDLSCGVKLLDTGTNTASRWRDFVDGLR